MRAIIDASGISAMSLLNGPVPERINGDLRLHQETVVGWRFSAGVKDLYDWAERMILEFKLEIPPPVLLIEDLWPRLGHFRHGRNGFGLRDEIAIDRFHLEGSPRWRVLGTLCHELLHSWQEHHGTPGRRNYHNAQFQEKARSFGLVVDRKGCTEYELYHPSLFRSFLQNHQVEIPPPESTDAPIPAPARPKPKLHLYECPCGVKVRVGRSRFNAKCLDCEGIFVLQDANAGSGAKPQARGQVATLG